MEEEKTEEVAEEAPKEEAIVVPAGDAEPIEPAE